MNFRGHGGHHILAIITFFKILTFLVTKIFNFRAEQIFRVF